MAEKTLNTRIVSKNAALSAWEKTTVADKGANYQLLEGEIALARVETAKADEWGNITNVPTYLMKIGAKKSDGTLYKFSELNWLAAPASDVHGWAKKSALAYDDLPETLKNEIDALQAAIGSDGSVATQIDAAIDAAIEALDVTDTAVSKQFVTAVSEANGKISVTRRALAADDIPSLAISKITNLQSTLDAKASKTDFDTLNNTVTNASTGLVKKLADETANRTSADEGLQSQIDTLKNTTIPAVDTKAGNAQTTANEAKTAANKAQGEVDALETTVATLTTTVTNNKTAAETAVSNEKSAREAADTALGERIDTLTTQIGDVTNIMNFKGVVASDPKNITTGYNNGDVVIYGNKEYVFSTSDNKFHEFGDTTADSAAITTLQSQMSTAQSNITTLQTNSATKTELSETKNELEDAIALKANASTVTTLSGDVSTLKTTVGSTSSGLVKDVNDLKTTVGSASSGLVKDVTDLKNNSATTSALNTAKTELQGLITDEAATRKSEDDKLDARLDTAESNITTLQSDLDKAEATIATHTNSINTINTELAKKALNADLIALAGRVTDIESDYLKAADTYIFDCGGAE